MQHAPASWSRADSADAAERYVRTLVADCLAADRGAAEPPAHYRRPLRRHRPFRPADPHGHVWRRAGRPGADLSRRRRAPERRARDYRPGDPAHGVARQRVAVPRPAAERRSIGRRRDGDDVRGRRRAGRRDLARRGGAGGRAARLHRPSLAARHREFACDAGPLGLGDAGWSADRRARRGRGRG